MVFLLIKQEGEMKRIVGVLMVLALICVFCIPAYAGIEIADKHYDDPELGAKADLPNLIRISKDLTIGLEGGKDVHKTDLDEGWFAYVKVTFTGSLLDFSK